MKKVILLAVLSIFIFSTTNSKAGSSLNESEKRLVYHFGNSNKCKTLLGGGETTSSSTVEEKIAQKQIAISFLEFRIIGKEWYKSAKKDPKKAEEVDVILTERAKSLISKKGFGLLMECMNSLTYIWGMFDYNKKFKE